MAMKLILDKIEDVPEAIRGEYEEKDGKFHLIVEDLEKSPLFEKLKANEQAARRSERALAAKVSTWEKLGKTEEEITALIAKDEQNEQQKLEDKGKWDELKKQMNEKHLLELEKKDKLTEAEKKKAEWLRGQIEKHLVDAQASAAISLAKGRHRLLLPIVKSAIKVTEDESGEFSTHIVDEKGGARVNGKGEPLTLAELLEEMRASEDLGGAFEGSGIAGTGAQPGGGVRSKSDPPAGTPKSWAEAKTPEDKAKFLAWNKTRAVG